MNGSACSQRAGASAPLAPQDQALYGVLEPLGKIFVALDVIILLTVGGIFYCIDEKKTKNKIKEKEFEKRHNERVEKAFREFDGLDMVKICASSNDYAA